MSLVKAACSWSSPSVEEANSPYFDSATQSLDLFALLGLAYPLALTGIGQLLFPTQANGSLVRDASGQAIGSTVVGQGLDSLIFYPLAVIFGRVSLGRFARAAAPAEGDVAMAPTPLLLASPELST